jgi:hypothetical protein
VALSSLSSLLTRLLPTWFTQLGAKPGPARVRVLASRLASQARACDAQALSNALYGLALLGLHNAAQVVAPLADAYVALLPQVGRAQSVCLVLWALPQLGHDPGPAFASAAVARALALAPQLGCADLVQLCTGMAGLGYAPGPRALCALEDTLEALLPDLEAAQLATVLGTFVRFGSDLKPAMARRIAERAHQLGGGVPLRGALLALGCLLK